MFLAHEDSCLNSYCYHSGRGFAPLLITTFAVMEKKPRESFVFYRSFYDAINKCPADSRLILYEAITRYALDGIEPRFKGILDLVWTLVKPQLDANWKRYLNGFKGGAPVGNQNAVKQPKNNQKTTTHNVYPPPHQNSNLHLRYALP